jgi:coenzyme Q-binding protein COQ10
MPRFASKRRVAHRADEMFDLVADVERYPEFVPLCRALKIRQRRPNADGTETIVADMTVSFKLVKETFTSEVTLDRTGRKIDVRYLRGPFANLENHWTFEPRSEDKDEGACDVGFFIAYEFKSRMLAMLMGTVFDAAFAKFSAAFEKRADVVYGKKTV